MTMDCFLLVVLTCASAEWLIIKMVLLQDPGKKKDAVIDLRAHACVKPMLMSKTISEIVKYCLQNERDDYLLSPPKDNPFREKNVACGFL